MLGLTRTSAALPVLASDSFPTSLAGTVRGIRCSTTTPVSLTVILQTTSPETAGSTRHSQSSSTSNMVPGTANPSPTTWTAGAVVSTSPVISPYYTATPLPSRQLAATST